MGLIRWLALMVPMLAWPASPAFAQASHSAEVHVSITVAPMAQVSFPQGTGFRLVVPQPFCARLGPFGWARGLRDVDRNRFRCALWSALWWPPIDPVRIPFIVRGNTPVTVTVTPSAFIRLRFGTYVGKALSNSGQSLPYNVIVHFPAPSPDYRWLRAWNDQDQWRLPYNWDGFGRLPTWSHVAELQGPSGIGTSPLVADLTARGGTAYGVIYIVAEQFWTAYGTGADPGNYYGAVDVAVTPSP